MKAVRSMTSRAMRFLSDLKINTRLALMILISGGQLVCVTAGLMWFGVWLSSGLMTQMREQVLVTNSQFASQTAEMIRRMKPNELGPGSPDWERVQKIIEQVKLPNDGYLSIVETREGRLLCHPELRQNPILASMRIGLRPLEGPHSQKRVIDAGAAEHTASGWIQLPDGRHLVAIHDLPELNAKVIAHQREQTIAQVIGHLNANVWSLGSIVAIVIAGATTGLTILIVRRYEHALASLNKGLETEVQRRSRALIKTRDAVIFGLARLAESRHEDTGEHLDRIRFYTEVLAREVATTNPAIDEETVNTIATASSLHDIGKVAVPDEVLLKPGKLTPRQRELMRRHTIIGGDCLLDIKRRLGVDDFLTTACQIALSHHERWNGTGYPFGLKGEAIPLAGRIVALADVYDALTSDRVYKCAMSHEKAKEMIVLGSGKHFDPQVVEAFLRAEHEFARIAAENIGGAPLQKAA
jgi:response regulator RpfG family c-di-GMP phosphodiesterase